MPDGKYKIINSTNSAKELKEEIKKKLCDSQVKFSIQYKDIEEDMIDVNDDGDLE